MTRQSSAVLAGASLLVIASSLSAHAQQAPASQRAAIDTTEEVIVTARRKDERLQDVPQTVTAVTSKEVEELNILRFEDLDKVVAGLQLSGSSGFTGSASQRGVTFNTISATTGSVAVYINEIPALSNALFQTFYDIGQIEVLRGPQGTLHGISAPSGAITYTTRRPDLNRYGGSASINLNKLDGHNLQAAVGVPLIPGKLAIRVAAMIDENDGNGVRSVNSRVAPQTKTDSTRISLRFDPTDDITLNVMNQHLSRRDYSFGSAVYGSGAPGGAVPAPTATGLKTPVNAPPAGYNGPVLGIDSNLAVADAPNDSKTVTDITTGELTYSHFGQRLSVVGSYVNYISQDIGGDADTLNFIPGWANNTVNNYSPDPVWTGEVRLSSEERIGGIFDYTLGVFHKDDRSKVNRDSTTFLAGAFGNPNNQPVVGPANLRFTSHSLIITPSVIKETSEFANVTGHLMEDKLEISGGVRRIDFSTVRLTLIQNTAGIRADSRILTPAACATAGGTYGTTYANVCDAPVAASTSINNTAHLGGKPFIWDASISYHFNPSLMVYAHAGSAWRPGPYVIGPQNFNNDPGLTALLQLKNEKSESYELGAKWGFLDHRGTLDVDVYHQTYDGLILTGPSVFYRQVTGLSDTVGSFGFTYNAPAKVDGFDVAATFDITKEWYVRGNFSWANGRLSGPIPCSDGNFDGVPDSIRPSVADFQAHNEYIAYCTAHSSTSTAAKWNFNIQSEFDLPINDKMDGFIRGLFNYLPKNPNSSPTYTIPAYALFDLYLGLRDPSGNWEVNLYGKNITDTHKITALQTSTPTPNQFFGNGGYQTVGYTLRREFGLNVRYAFGSR